MTSGSAQPNIVLIHGHDIGRWLSCYDAPEIPTPNLANLAASSVLFEQAFAAAPLCTPARGAMLTGRAPHSNGLIGLAHDSWLYYDDVRTLPELLRDQGYHTTLIGLQHENPDPKVLGYDEVRGLGFLPRTEQVVDAALTWFAEPLTGPYFCNIGCWEAHRPWSASDYPPRDPSDVRVPAYLPDNAFTRVDIAAMYSALAQFDREVGRLLSVIDPETLLVVTTDHGAPFPRAKSTLYDSGVGVALIVRPPASWGVQPRRDPSIVSHLDLVPTLMELAGGPLLPQWDGQSLVEVIVGASQIADRELFLEKTYHDSYDPMRAVRTRDRKYIRNFTPGPLLTLASDLESSITRQGMGDAHLAPRPMEELYDLQADPDELTNVADSPDYRNEVPEFRERLFEWMRQTGDELLNGPIPPAPDPVRPTRPRRPRDI